MATLDLYYICVSGNRSLAHIAEMLLDIEYDDEVSSLILKLCVSNFTLMVLCVGEFWTGGMTLVRLSDPTDPFSCLPCSRRRPKSSQIDLSVGGNMALNRLLSFYHWLRPVTSTLRLIFSDTTILSRCLPLLSSGTVVIICEYRFSPIFFVSVQILGPYHDSILIRCKK